MNSSNTKLIKTWPILKRIELRTHKSIHLNRTTKENLVTARLLAKEYKNQQVVMLRVTEFFRVLVVKID